MVKESQTKANVSISYVFLDASVMSRHFNQSVSISKVGLGEKEASPFIKGEKPRE